MKYSRPSDGQAGCSNFEILSLRAQVFVYAKLPCEPPSDREEFGGFFTFQALFAPAFLSGAQSLLVYPLMHSIWWIGF